MESRKVPALLALVGIVVAVGLFLVLKDDTADDDTIVPPPQESATGEGPGEGKNAGDKPERDKPAKPEVPVIEIRDGQPVGGVQDLEFKKGDEVRIEIRANTDEEVHLHGYDITLPVPAGKPSTLSFKADLDGGYELESHVTAAPLAQISILPD
jgi:hypothetical protein